MTNHNNQIAYFRLDYPAIEQAPDALLARAEEEVRGKFLEPDNFTFITTYDTFPDEEDAPDAGLVRVVVVAQSNPRLSLWDRLKFAWPW